MHQFVAFVCCLDDAVAILSDSCDTALCSRILKCPKNALHKIQGDDRIPKHLDRDQGIKCQNQGDN